MRRINVRFAAALAIVLALTAGASYGLYVFQHGRIAQSLLWQAHKHRDENQPEKAIKLAGQYLQFQPDDTAVMLEMSEWLRERASSRKQLAGIAGLYERILRINAGDDDVRRKAAKAYYSLGYYREAYDHLERLLPTHSGDAELLVQRGYCLQSMGKYQQAAEFFDKAIAADARYAPAYAYAAALQSSQLKNPERAAELYARAVAANPDSAEARASLAAHYRRQRKFEDATREVTAGLAKTPDDATLLLTAADIASATGDLKKSLSYLDRGFEKHPNDTRFVCSLSWQLLYDGRADLAVQKLRAGKAANPNDIDILTLLGDILAQDGQIAPLEETLKELQEAQAPAERVQPRIQYVEARLLMRRGRIAEAAQKLDGLLALGMRMPSLYRQVNSLLAQCAEQLGDSAGELNAIRRLLDNDPNAGAMRLEYARALARAGQCDDAQRELLSVLPRPQVSSRLVADTTRTMLNAARRNPESWTKLQQALDGLKLDDANPNPTIARAELERVRERPDSILAQIVRNIGKQPSNVALHAARVNLFELKYDSDRALVALNEAEKLIGDHGLLRTLRARLMATRLDRSNLDSLIALGAGIEKFTADDRLTLLREIVSGCRLLGDNRSAAQVLERIAESRPDDFAAREELFSAALRTNDAALMARVLAGLEALEGKGGPCRIRLDVQRALWESDSAVLTTAAARLDAVAAAHPTDAVIPYLRGRIAELAGQSDAARRQYRAAFEKGLLSRPIEELLACAPGRSGQASLSVIRDEMIGRIDFETPRSIVVATLPLLDPPAAARFADRLAGMCKPTDGAKQAWLGRLFGRMGLAQKSDESFRRAASASSQSHEGWLSLVAERIQQGDAGKLNAAYAEVRQALPPIDAELLIGKACETAKRYEEARRAYEGAAALKPDEPRALKPLAAVCLLMGRPTAARAPLEALTRLPESNFPEDVRWARRTLALQCAFTPSLAEFERAMSLIDANKVGAGWTEDDTRARAVILATQKGRQLPGKSSTARQDAIQLLEAILQRGSTRAADDLILLAKLYRGDGRDDLARQTCERLRTQYADHYSAAAFLAREAIRDAQLPQCERYLQALRRLGPGQFETLAIEFHYFALVGDAGRASQIVTEHVAAGVDEADRWNRSVRAGMLVAEFLQSFPLKDRAESAAALRSLGIKIFAQCPPQYTADSLPQYIVLLVNNNEIARAFELAQVSRQSLPAEVVAAAQVLIFRHARVGDVQAKATLAFLREQIEKKPASVALRLSLADFYQYTADRVRAIESYRAVLQREPDNVVALNNLAYTLASDPSQSKDALTFVQRAIDLLGPNDELLDTRARILAQAGDVQAGVRDMVEAANDSPSAARYHDLSVMARKAGQSDLADRALNRARQYGHGDGPPDSR